MPTLQFKEGDVVQLKSGGPKMTCTGEETERGEIYCQWFAGSKLELGHFPPGSLKKADEVEPKAR